MRAAPSSLDDGVRTAEGGRPVPQNPLEDRVRGGQAGWCAPHPAAENVARIHDTHVHTRTFLDLVDALLVGGEGLLDAVLLGLERRHLLEQVL